MIHNLFPDSGPGFIREGQRMKPPPLSRSDVKPQFVHRVALKPPPEIRPKCRSVKQRCVRTTLTAVIYLLLLLLVAGVLLAYYLSSSCVHGMRCADGSCVWRSQWCDGVTDCPAGRDEAHCVRLHGSGFLLQIYSTQSGAWRPVCSHGWTERQGRASCLLVGYSRGTYFKSGQQTSALDDGYLMAKSGFDPEASILQQLVLSNTCPNNSAVTLRCTDCGRRVNSSRASGGQAAPPGAWPWQVSLQVSGSHRCGGAAIAPYWIVTAAHCVARDPNPDDWVVYAGVVDPLGPLFNPAYRVSRVIAHEGFDWLTRRNDVALMKLSEHLDLAASSKIRPVCLPNVGVSAPQRGWVTLFDPTPDGDSGSLHLTEARVYLISSADCNDSLAHEGRISRDMLCAAETQAGASTFHTDSGGPLVSLKDGVWWLVGDSIWGGRCTEQNKPEVYGNVTYFLDWIYHQMRKHQDD
ncbi:transmembrane protease serine 2-like [Pungitius pungitius]|uniref:transmembrane protease serine 2-like n=1 Tax=Pungitius pungitius TaxID=134920 RepID=UPI002E113F19